MTFPTAHSQIYYNEDGEVIGWDNVDPDAERDSYWCDDCGFHHAGACPDPDADEPDEDDSE